MTTPYLTLADKLPEGTLGKHDFTYTDGETDKLPVQVFYCVTSPTQMDRVISRYFIVLV